MSLFKKTAILLIPILLLFMSLFIGRFDLSTPEVLSILSNLFFKTGGEYSESGRMVLLKIRLPRAIAALIVGGSLAVSGAAFQGIFRNPLVSPSLLGVSSSAGFGAGLALLFSMPGSAVHLSAFLFGLIGVGIAYLISRIYKRTQVLMLVLAGVVVSSFFSSMISLLKYTADPDEKLPEIVFWLMGSLSDVSSRDVWFLFPGMVIGTVPLLLLSWRINILSMGEKQAGSLGMNVEVLKLVVIICCTVLTASAICISGTIGWVGLLIPHICRMILGSDNRHVFAASFALGGSYLLIVDTIARSITMGEIPLGILTSIIGAPFFAYLLRKTRGGETL